MEPSGDPARYTLAATNNPLSKLSCVSRDSVRGIPFGNASEKFTNGLRHVSYLHASKSQSRCAWIIAPHHYPRD